MRFHVFTLMTCAAVAASAAELKEAKVTQVIHDVKLLGGRQASRAASVNDAVRQGDAVRTGQESRAELTFSDLTITRLGANTVFSFNEAGREVTLDSGALLLEVPRDGAPARINSAGVTAAISGGTAMFEANKGYPKKFMVLEGKGQFCTTSQPPDCVEVPAGELVTFFNGKISKPEKFNVGVVVKTAKLLTDFPELPNADLIQEVIDLQGENPPGPHDQDPLNQDKQDQANSGVPPNNPPGGGNNSAKFGPPVLISSPDPYVIDSSTVIQTDPTITTNGVTDLGKIYRGAQDGTPSQYLYGNTTSFDQLVFMPPFNDAYAVFKFAHLQLAGNPTVTIPSGSVNNLALVSVGDMNSTGPGGTLTFAGINRLFLGTENGSINLGSEISFSGFSRLDVYARGADSDLFMGSAATTDNHIHLYAENDIDVENELTTSNFKARAGNDFFIGKGTVSAFDIDIGAGNNISFYAESLPNPNSDGLGGAVILDAGNTLTINGIGFGEGTFGWDTLEATANTINLNAFGGLDPGKAPPFAIFDFSDSSSVTITAGAGGINASQIDFFGHNLTLDSEGNISIYAATTPTDDNTKEPFLDGSITAAGTIESVGDVDTGTLTSGGDTTITTGNLRARSIQVGDLSVDAGSRPSGSPVPANLTVGQDITAVGGSIDVTGDLTSNNGTITLEQDESHDFGNIHAGGNISAPGGIFTPGDPCIVFAGGTISAPEVITGTLHGVAGITIDNSSGDFTFGIIANNVITGGTLTMINVPQVTPNNRTASGGVGFTPVDFMLQAASISSSGDTIPSLTANGDNASQDGDIGNPGNGGKVTVDITAGSLTVGQATAVSNGGVRSPAGEEFDLSTIEANGGNFDSSLSGSINAHPVAGPLGGNGGQVQITTTADFSLAPFSYITATTGSIPFDGPEFAGNGGEVTVDVPGAITVDGAIQVSSDDGIPKSPAGDGSSRRSASGGNIKLTSSKADGVAIDVSSSGQLLALLNDAAPGSGGSIKFVANGKGSSIHVAGQVEADKGLVDVRHTDDLGQINLSTVMGDGAFNITADIVKIGALGTNGHLTIGVAPMVNAGSITANTLLALYAGGGSGVIDFKGDVTLSAGSFLNIAAKTVNIFDGVTVTIDSKTSVPADVYTDNPNYAMSSGGNGTHSGTFAGAGANAPHPYASAPPFDTGAHPGRRH